MSDPLIPHSMLAVTRISQYSGLSLRPNETKQVPFTYGFPLCLAKAIFLLLLPVLGLNRASGQIRDKPTNEGS